MRKSFKRIFALFILFIVVSGLAIYVTAVLRVAAVGILMSISAASMGLVFVIEYVDYRILKLKIEITEQLSKKNEENE